MLEIFILLAVIGLVLIMWFSIKPHGDAEQDDEFPADESGSDKTDH